MAGALVVGGFTVVRMLQGGSGDSLFTPFATGEPQTSASYAGVSPATPGSGDSYSPPTGPPLDPDQSARSSNDPLIQTAQTFIEHARKPDSTRAIQMLDEDLFHQRFHGPQGSRDAVLRSLESGKVLAHIASRSFESTPGNEALRHWQVLGRTEFRGSPAVVIRYYADLNRPVRLVDDETLRQLSALMSYDEYLAAARDLYLPHSEGGDQSNFIPNDPDANGVFVPRAGHLLLVFAEKDGQLIPCDLVNGLGLLPLSRTAGQAYMREWNVINFGQSEIKNLPEEGNLSLLGESPVELGVVSTYGIYFRKTDYNGGIALNEAQFSAGREVRAVRLSEIAAHLHSRLPQTPQLVAAFRQDFPGDDGADQLVVTTSMIPEVPRLEAPAGAWIRDSAESLYMRYRDPFLLFVQALVADSAGQPLEARRLMDQARHEGFQSADMYRFYLTQALKKSDKAESLAVLQQMSGFWGDRGFTISDESLAPLRDRWRQLAEQNNAGQDGAVADGGGSSPRGPFDRFTPGSSANKQPPPGFVPDSSQRVAGPQSGPPPSSAPPALGTSVTVIVTSGGPFDHNAVIKRLLLSLNTGNSQMSRSGATTTMNIEFGGPLQTVVDAIDFGTVESRDEASRTIRVAAP